MRDDANSWSVPKEAITAYTKTPKAAGQGRDPFRVRSAAFS